MSTEERLLTGWGRTAPSRAAVARPRSAADVADALAAAPPRGVVARGLGRAYGDAAQNAGGVVLDMTGLDAIHGVDVERREVDVAAGVSLERLMRALLPLGLFVPVSPGTRHVTVGGAVAADIHGKNHHRDGAFGRHVREIELVTPAGEALRLAPGDARFAATVGGMGLTGVVTRVRLGVIPVQSSAVVVDTERARDLDDLLGRMAAADHRYAYSVAWIDCLARGRSLGRGVLTRGDHASRDAVSGRGRAGDPLRFSFEPRAFVPAEAPGWLLSRAALRAFNALWFRRARERRGELQPLSRFFHPLDGVAAWNRLYGPRGLVQHQSVVPFGREDVLRELIEAFSTAGAGSLLAVLKRFGPGTGMLSFPMEGWTLALDVPAGRPGLARLLDRLDERVAAAGGRVYLAKDSRLRADLVAAMYPELPAWRDVRAELDPHGVLRSDLARRLGLVAA